VLSPTVDVWPLVGREGELERIAQARADSGCPGVVVSAVAGVGKSRLAREALAAAQREGAVIHWAQATTSAAAVPLGAFAGLVRDEVRSDEPLELMRRSAEALGRRSDGRMVVVGVDDAQLLDPVSAALVLHLTVTGSAFVLATVRVGEPYPDAIVSLWKDSGARRMELERLDDDAVGALVESALRGPLEQAALEWVIESSQGNALYVHELVVGAIESGTLALERGLWRLSHRPRVGRTLVELIGQRMSTLTREQRAPIELLALAEPLRPDEIVGLAGQECVTEVEALGVVTVAGQGALTEVRLAHPLYGEVVRAELPVLRARGLRLRLAETLQGRDPLSSDDALRVARLLLDGGGSIPPGLVLDAAQAANLAGDPDLGARLAELALAGGAGLRATLLLARAHTVRQQPEEAEAVLAAAEPSARRDALAVNYLEQRLSVLYWGLQRNDEARDLIERAQTWSDDPEWRRRLGPLRLGLAGLIEGFRGSVAVASEILADPALDEGSRRRAEQVKTMGLFFTGHAREAWALVRRLRPSVPLEDPNEAIALGMCWMIGIESGEDWTDFESYMSEVLRAGVRAGDHEAAGIGAFSLANLRFLEGRYHDSARWFAEAELHFEHQDTFGSVLHVRVFELGIRYFTGDLGAVAPALDAVLGALGGREPLRNQRPWVARAQGWAARARSDAAGADVLIRKAAEIDVAIHAAPLTYEAMRAGAPPAAKLQDLARLCDARLLAAYVEHAVALAARDAPGLRRAAETMAAIGARRYGMEAAVQAAETFLAEGRQDSARRAVALARELHVPGQGAEFPEIDGLDATATGLTRREAQIAALAARGLTNAEIAEQLVLSVRTVETYVYRAMQKRGVTGRHEL
jgi:DNA-binding NarL/FixJ family response regulator